MNEKERMSEEGSYVTFTWTFVVHLDDEDSGDGVDGGGGGDI